MATIRHPIAEMKLYSVILCGLLCGCALPPPLDVISLAKTTVDVILMVQDKPTTTDIVLSGITGKECRTFNVIQNMTVCKRNKIVCKRHRVPCEEENK